MKSNYIAIAAITVVLFACNPEKKNQDSSYRPLSKSEKIERGKYLVTSLGCNDCHSPKVMTERGPQPDPERLLSGHSATEKLPPYDRGTSASYVLFNMNGTAVIGPWGTSFAANLTPDETGLGNWTEARFLVAMKQGKWKGIENSRPLLPPMPWEGYSHMTDDDLTAIFAYLQSLKPVRNIVPSPVDPNIN